MEWWNDLWAWAQLPLGATIVGGLAVLVIAAIVPRLRKPVFGLLGLVFRFVLSLRLVTSGYIRKTKQNGREELQAEIDAARRKPVRRPRWVIMSKPNGERGDYVLANTIEGSVARNVMLDTDSSSFTFFSPADWEDVSNEKAVTFRGALNRNPGSGLFGVAFWVEWDDALGERQGEEVTLRNSL